MLPARSAIQLNQHAETENLPIEDLILVNCETQQFVSKTELTILPTDFPGVMPIGAWEQKKRIPTDQSIPCFTAGTLIGTRDGQKRIEDLRPGDHVITRDSGFVQVQAISQQSYSPAEQRLNTDFRPIVIPAGTFGNSRGLHLSPAHRLMVTNNQAELLFGSSEVLVTAKTALEYAWVHQQPVDFDVTYFHILLITHELVLVEEMWAESLFLGDMPERVLEPGKIWETLDGFDMSQATHNGTVRRLFYAGTKHVRLCTACQIASTKLPRDRPRTKCFTPRHNVTKFSPNFRAANGHSLRSASVLPSILANIVQK